MKYLTPAEVKILFPEATTRTYSKGQILFYPGDKPDYICFILSGTVKYYDISDGGNEKILHLLNSNAFFPMLSTFDTVNEIIAFYSTLDEAEVMMVRKKEFKRVLESNLTLANKLLRTLAEEMTEIIKHINSISKTDSHQKVEYVLGYLLNKHASDHTKRWSRVNFPVNQQLIADLAGVTRETVSGIMQEFEAEKVVRTPKLLVLDINKTKLSSV